MVSAKDGKKTAGKKKKTAKKKVVATVKKKVAEKKVTKKKVTKKTVAKKTVAKKKVTTKKVAKKAVARKITKKKTTKKILTKKVTGKISTRKNTALSKRSGRGEVQALSLTPDQLSWRCNFGNVGFESTADMPEYEGIIGQSRAMESIALGLKMRSKGFNIYVAGPAGTGKMTTVKHQLATVETGREVPPDVVYVNNFINSDMPRSILIDAGLGCKLKKDMETLVINMRRNIAQIYESDDFKDRMKAVVEEFTDREKVILRAFEDKIRKENFALIQVQMGPFSKPEIAPVIAGEPVQIERLEVLTQEGKFSQDELGRLKVKYGELTTDMELAFRAARDLKRELRDVMTKLQKDFGSPAVTDYIADLTADYNNAEILEYFTEVQEAILDNMERFIDNGEGDEEQKPKSKDKKAARFRDFSVNILVDNKSTDKPPVIIETNPNYRNLFGTIERTVDRSGHWVSDFTKIKAGSLLRANGGTLVINLMDAVVEQGVWLSLKRALKHRKIDIQTFDPFYIMSVSALKPEPIDLDVKVIVTGDRYIYQLLYNYDEDFRKIFKVKAEFDNVMEMNGENVVKYMNFARKITSEEKLLPITIGGIGSLVEYGVRLGGRKTKISTSFGAIADLIRESDLWAREKDEAVISPEHVEKAVFERERRISLTEEKIRSLIEEGVIFIDSEGERVGQINGLSVLDLGDYAFGQPSRITVKCSLGREGIVNIEREANMSGKTHNKGMLILEGWLRSTFAKDKPLSVNATICFEQNYGGIDGDSASSTEIYGLLSALSNVPLRQDIAVTGSVNQHGEIQPIGGVNEKIEGFFDICRQRGLTGTQGVMMPASNVADLMLRPRVVTAVEEGRFQIWAITTIEQGIEILTGRRAGKRDNRGVFPSNTIFGMVDKTLLDYAVRFKNFGIKRKKK